MKPYATSWSKDEMKIIEAHYLNASDKEIAERLRKAGFIRTPPAVKNARARNGWRRARAPDAVERRGGQRPRSDGWPVMHGEDHERDEQFWKAVLKHAVECGEIKITKDARC